MSSEVITTKVCSKCNNTYNIDEFQKRSSICKPCKAKYARERRLKMKENFVDLHDKNETKKCCICENTKNISEFNRDGNLIRDVCKKCRAERDRIRKDEILSDEHKHEEYLCKRREYSKNHPEKHREQNKRYKAKNKDKINKKSKEYRDTHPQYRISLRCRTAIRKCFRGKHTIAGPEILGCDRNLFIKWITYQFDKNMTMDNYGSYWSFDHIIPIYMYNLLNVTDVINCFHFTNTRPIEKQENQIKNKYLTSDDIINHNKIITKFCVENNIIVDNHLLIVQFGNQN